MSDAELDILVRHGDTMSGLGPVDLVDFVVHPHPDDLRRCTYKQIDTPVDRFIYIIGSLRNPHVPQVAQTIREKTNYEVFDDWFAAGPEADDKWKTYESDLRGRTYSEALGGYAAKNVFEFDKRHLNRATDVVLVLPAGKSGHLELGWSAGKGKRTYILLEPDTDPRWDVMYQFANHVVDDIDDLIERIKDGELH